MWGRKSEWRSWRDQLSQPFTAVHLDERSPVEREASEGRTPCVLVHSASGVDVLVGPAELDACGGDPETLVKRIQEALEARAGAA